MSDSFHSPTDAAAEAVAAADASDAADASAAADASNAADAVEAATDTADAVSPTDRVRPSSGGAASRGDVRFVDVRAIAPDGYSESCLRPLGLCELGGSCDACWYGPNNPASPLRRR